MKTLAFILMLLATPTLSCDEHYWLALTIYHEARNQEVDGQIMVAEVVLNRVERDRWPDTICDVVKQPSQFSWTTKDVTPHEKDAWEEAKNLAEEILSGETETMATGATHFINPRIVKKPPAWTKRLELVGKIGDHVFYRRPHDNG